MRRAVRLGCGRRSLCVVAVFAASALAVLLAQASDGGTHTVAHPDLAVAAVVDVRVLARVPEAPSGEADQEMLEPQERAEPNIRRTVPSQFAPLLQAPERTTATPSPYVSESFLAQADVPAVGSTKTESPPDTNGAVGRDKLRALTASDAKAYEWPRFQGWLQDPRSARPGRSCRRAASCRGWSAGRS